jgi:uncharacterized lipoprotein YajG
VKVRFFMNKLVTVAAVVLFAGCTTVSQWTNDANDAQVANGGSPTKEFTSQLARDRYDCVRDALQGTSVAAGSPLMVLGAEIDNTNRHNMVFRLCMEARGYTLIK